MAHLARSVLRPGAASGGISFIAAPANGQIACRAMSTLGTAKALGSLIGRPAMKVRGRLTGVQRVKGADRSNGSLGFDGVFALSISWAKLAAAQRVTCREGRVDVARQQQLVLGCQLYSKQQ